MGAIELTVVYDNYRVGPRLQTAHGFACIARAGGSTVLFDTGGSGQILLENMAALGLAVGQIDAVVLSHMHWDHIGRLDAVLAANPDLTVYAPALFSPSFRQDLRERARSLVETKSAQQVTDGIWTTDVLESPLVEQALYVLAAEGIVVLTGCAHPGVVELVGSAKRTSGRRVHAVLGGFHLSHMSRAEISEVIDGLRELGVERVGPCHCSGDEAREAVREAFGDHYVRVGVGARLGFPPAEQP